MNSEEAIIQVAELLPRLLEELEEYNRHQTLKERSYPAYTKYDRESILKLVKELQDMGPLSTGILYDAYTNKTGLGVTRRQFFNILHRLEGEGYLNGVVDSKGRYGRSTLWTVEAK